MDNLENMRQRLEWHGGIRQEDRMIEDKYRTFLKALEYSYQACDVRKQGETTIWRALINSYSNRYNYDAKMLSIDYASGFKIGNVFNWVNTNSYWLITSQELSEDAYFRAEIKRCNYELEWVEDGVKKKSWAAITRQTQGKIDHRLKENISFDMSNYELIIDMPYSEDAVKRFKRYERFYFKGITWQVQVVDTISQEGVITLACLENYTNPTLDIEDETDKDPQTGKITVIPYDDEKKQFIKDLPSEIEGKTFIKPTIEEIYTCGDNSGVWSIKENRPILLTPFENGVKLKWTKLVSGQFTLQYNDDSNSIKEKTIVVESLF